MGTTVTRPIKRGQVRKFEESYQKGFKNVWATEMDADLDILYDAWNFGIVNIPDGSITSIMLQDGCITNSKLSSNCVEGANIKDGSVDVQDLTNNVTLRLTPFYSAPDANKILAVNPTGSGVLWATSPPSAPGGPATGDLTGTYPAPTIGLNKVKRTYLEGTLNGCIPPNVNDPQDIGKVAMVHTTGMAIWGTTPPSPPIGAAGGDLTGTYPNPTIGPGAITNAKLAPGAGVSVTISGQLALSLNFSASAETTVLTFTNITTRGSAIRLSGSWGLYTTGAATGYMSIYFRVKRSGTVIHEVLQNYGTNYTVPIPVPECIDNFPPAGTYSYTITAQVTGNGIVYSRGVANENGKLWLQEI